jgi:hypothetical protein
MPFITAPLSDAKESETVPEGTYHIRNHSIEERDSKNGKAMIVVTSVIESEDFPNAAPIMTYLSLPDPDDEPRASAFKNLQLRRFCECFEIPFEDNGFNTDDIPGSEGECAVSVEMYRPMIDGKPDMSKAEIATNRLNLPRLQGEPEERAEPPRRAAGAQQSQKRTAGRR